MMLKLSAIAFVLFADEVYVFPSCVAFAAGARTRQPHRKPASLCRPTSKNPNAFLIYEKGAFHIEHALFGIGNAIFGQY